MFSLTPPSKTKRLASHPLVVLAAGLIWVAGIVYLTQTRSNTETRVLGEQLTRPTVSAQLLDSRDFEVGKCYDWSVGSVNSAQGYATTAIDCNEPHRFEMVATVTLKDHSNDFPVPEEWSAITRDLCTASITKYLGTPLDPQGKYYVDSVYPGESSWNSGERDISCGIGAISSDYKENREGIDATTTGKADAKNQQLLYGTGSCIRRDEFGSGAVDCAALHNEEIVGQITVGTESFASDDAFQKAFASQCKAQAKEALKRDLADDEFAGVLGRISSVKLGTRVFECYVTKVDAGNNELSWSGLLRLQS